METLKTKTTLSTSEFRIGNLVNHPIMGYCKVICIRAKSYDCATIDGGDWFISENSEPIPLSPDILLSAGFKYLKVEGVSSFEEFHNPDEDTHCWSFNVKSTDLIDSHEICLVKWGEEEYFTFQLGRGTYRKKIKYLHELQNGMFFLTGEELTINL